MSALERAEDDIRQGDLAMARQRLTSLLDARGYDPGLAARIGRIALDMHDPFEAGRFWLLSDAVGAEVEHCIDVFVRRAGGKPEAMVRYFSRGLRVSDVDLYVAVARERIARYGLHATLLTIRPRDQSFAGTSRAAGKLFSLGCFLLVALLIGVFAVGVVTVVGWFV